MVAISSVSTATPAAGASGAQPRLVRAAHEFEAQMLKELLDPVAKNGGLSGGEDDGDAGSGGVMGQFASEAFAGALSSQGGFGIARQIVRDLSHSGNQSATTPVIGNLHVDTGMRRAK